MHYMIKNVALYSFRQNSVQIISASLAKLYIVLQQHMSTTEVFLVAFQILLAEIVVCDRVCAINSALDEQSIGVSVLCV